MPPSASRKSVGSKTPSKSPAAAGAGKKKSKRGKKRVESYSSYIFKVMKQIHPDTGISKLAMAIMNSFINDIFEKIATEAGRVVRKDKKLTLSAREIQTAVLLTFPGELARHAITGAFSCMR